MRSTERGVALLMVITVLVTLVIIATAFAPQMRRGRERTEANAARARADFEARQLARTAQLFLSKSHPRNEIARADQGELGVDADPKVDTLPEITPGEEFRSQVAEEIRTAWTQDRALSERLAHLERRGLGPLNDDRGSIWTVIVRDAQALVNVNGSSPYLIANLLGSALLSEDVDPGAPDILVEHVAQSQLSTLGGFAPSGGYIRIGNEVIKYREFDGSAFRGCERAMLRNAPLNDNGGAAAHEKGAVVIDYTAYKLATHLIAKRPGSMTAFESMEDLRSIGTWGDDGVLTAHRLAQLRPYLTLDSRRESAEGWLASQLVVEQLPTSVDGDAQDVVKVRDVQNPTGTTSWFNAGTLVRVTDGINTSYQMVQTPGDPDGRLVLDREFTLAGRVDAAAGEGEEMIYKGGETLVEARAPFPININTASIEVLYAVMANLQHRFAKEAEHIVTPDVAWALAEAIVSSREGEFEAIEGTEDASKWRKSGPFRNAEDFGRFLKERVDTHELTRAQQFALYTNAINPHANTLAFGTAPWCFRTLDVYHVESRVAINNRNGEQIASTTIREVVEVGADEVTSWSLDTQADFEDKIQMGSGAKFVASYPFGVTFVNEGQHHVQPRQRAPKHIVRNIYPSTKAQDGSTSEDVGDIRLEPVRIRLPGAVVADHFDWNIYQDGHRTDIEGAYTRKIKGTLRGDGQDFVQPFSMSFWWRSFSEGDSWTAFDCGVDTFLNRFAVFVTVVEGQRQLVFRTCAGTMERRGAEVYVPLERLDYQAGNWYHIQVSCVGEDPSTMQLLVDGLDVAERRGMTVLEGGLDLENPEVIVRSTSGFPQIGAIQVGTEIIEYDLLDPTAFRECVRGARGTRAGSWVAGTPVRILGYSMPLLMDVMAGGAHLTEELLKWSALRVTGEGYDDTINVAVEGLPTPIALAGFAPENTAPQNFQVAGMWGQDVETAAGAFGTKGYALLGCWRINGVTSGGGSGGPAGPEDEEESEAPPVPGGGVPPGLRGPPDDTVDPGSDPVPTPDPGDTTAPPADSGAAGNSDTPVGGWEVVYYTRQGTTFTVERYQQTDWQAAAEPYFLVTQVLTSQRDFPCFLVPISVQGLGQGVAGDDYLNPADPQHERIVTAYGGDGTARIFIGTDTPEDQYEVIRYDSIDRQKAGPDILFVRDRALNSTTNHFFGQTTDVTAGTPTDPEDPLPDPVPPEGPDDPTDPGGGGLEPPGDPAPPPGEETEDPPTPGGGVPPGLRDPGEPDIGDSDVPTDTGDGGSGESPSEPGVGGGGSGGGGDLPGGDDAEEPVEPVDQEEDASPGGDLDPGARPGGEDGSSGGGGGGTGGDTGGDGGDTTSPPLDELDPPPDSSGEGESEESEEDPTAQGQVPPDLRDPEDPELPSDTEGVGGGGGGGGQWDPLNEPVGPETARNLLQFRGVSNTFDRDHTGGGQGDRNSRIIPCFKVWEEHTGNLFRRTGRNDTITILDGGESGSSTRIEALVRWGDEFSNWTALDDFTEQRIQAPAEGADVQRLDLRGRPRILKFPCGELPDEMSTELEFGKSTIASSEVVTAFLDELNVFRHPIGPLAFVVNAEGIDAAGTEITLIPQFPAATLEDTPGWNQNCGVFQIGGELIVYRGAHSEGDGRVILERCVRGAFATEARHHALAAYGRFLPDVPVSYLDGSVARDSASIPLIDTKGFPTEGLVRILGQETGELVHYTRLTEQELTMPQALDSTDAYTQGRGLLRGRFGTMAQDHDSDAVVVSMPFRYWDRYAVRATQDGDAFSGVHDHAESGYVEFGLRRNNAYWHSLRWEENLDGQRHGEDLTRDDRGSSGDTGRLDIVVLARFSSNVPWDSEDVVDMRAGAGVRATPSQSQARSPNSLYVFDDPESINEVGFEADSAQFRVYFVYRSNAYVFLDTSEALGTDRDEIELTNWWKRSPWLQSFTASYTNRTRTLSSAKAGRGR